ncbi:MAG: HAMP domain-containing sensor histidine kinase [Anaerovoracaceae bacterium]
MGKLDFKSLKIKLWIYFGLFAIVLMAILWFLQIFFLQNYYEEMKTREIVRIAGDIAGNYGTLDLEKMAEYSIRNDMYIHLESSEGLILYSTSGSSQRPSMLPYSRDISNARTKLLASTGSTVSYIDHSSPTGINTLVYGKRIQNEGDWQTYLFILSPLSPVESTVGILTQQLIIVTIASLILAFALSFFLSRRLTRPLSQITQSASRLAKGEYGITFEGGHYSEIVQLADTLTYTARELARTDELKKDLLANVSHDLRTPLTMVKSYAEMIRDISGDNPEKRNSHIQVIIDEADRLNVLVTDLMTLSKMQAGFTPISPEIFNLSEIISGLLNSYAIMVEQGGYTINYATQGNAEVWGDPQRIKQVISNLINNAIKFSEPSKVIDVLIDGGESGVLFQVTDYGVGIPQEELEHIWERYYRASHHGRRPLSGGSGLGLSIVKEILSSHQADFGVKSEIGKGSTFWFILKRQK